jgi:FkbM family methyltransferase
MRGVRDALLVRYARLGWRGFDRLSGAMLAPGERIQARLRFGGAFALDPHAYIDRIALREGYYETEVLEALLAYVGAGALWDIGANAGLHGITVKKLRPTAQVVCFEPSPPMLEVLHRNIRLNGLDVQVMELALSDRGGEQVFHVSSAGNPGMSTLRPWSGARYERQIVVKTATGDALVESGEAPAPTVVKVDVEGHELEVLRGLSRTLGKLRAVVFEDALDDTEVKALLRAAGFTIEPLRRRERSHHALNNFLAVRQGMRPEPFSQR